MNAKSVWIAPRPRHCGQAPRELKLNRPGAAPVAREKIFRTWSKIPRYVAGVDLDEAPTGDWSTTTASGWRAHNSPWISELFPEPATPVTAVSTPVGTRTDTSRRLFRRAPSTASQPEGGRTRSFSTTPRRSARPVAVSAAASPATGPAYTTSPPCTPPPGPMSTT